MSATSIRTPLPHAPRGEIFFDLSEALGVGTGRLKYYGIARVVVELGIELARLERKPRFVIFSPGHRRFFEVEPVAAPSAYGGIDLRTPPGCGPAHIREVEHDRNFVYRSVASLARMAVRIANRRRWRQANLSTRPVDMHGHTLVSGTRPKKMVAMLEALRRSGQSVNFAPLLYDLIPLHDFSAGKAESFPRNFLADNRYVLERSNLVLAISRFTCDDMRQFEARGVLPKIPTLIAVPLAHECRETPETAQIAAPETPYILTVGSQTGRKNLDIVLEAMLDFDRRHGVAPRLVLAGAARRRVHRFIEQPRYASLRDRIVEVHDPAQADLIELYKHASAVVLPSRIEGWGLPAAEALWFGTPALCSTAPVLREVCGDAAFYFDPDRPDQLADQIARIMRGDRPPLAQDMRTWADVARDLMAALAPFDAGAR